MSDYLKAYGERLERNHKALVQLIHNVQQIDNTVEAYINNDRKWIQNVVFIKDNKINSIWFHEVPYRWSGCGYGEFNKSHSGGENSSMPFDADDVINNFQPIQTNTYIKGTKESYLKFYSFYTLYKPQNI